MCRCPTTTQKPLDPWAPSSDEPFPSSRRNRQTFSEFVLWSAMLAAINVQETSGARWKIQMLAKAQVRYCCQETRGPGLALWSIALSCYLVCLHLIPGYSSESQLFYFQSGSPNHPGKAVDEGSSARQGDTQGRTRWSSGFRTSSQISLRRCGHLGSEPEDANSFFVFLCNLSNKDKYLKKNFMTQSSGE